MKHKISLPDARCSSRSDRGNPSGRASALKRAGSLIFVLASLLAMLCVSVGAAGAEATQALKPVRATVVFDQTFWQAVPGLRGAPCLRTRIQGTIRYEYVWVLEPLPSPGHVQKTYPVLNKTTIVNPRVRISAWNKCSPPGRKPFKLSGASFEQRWLNSNECSINGLSLAAGYPWGAQVGTTITCGSTTYVGRKSDFSKPDNDYEESNSNARIDIGSAAMMRKGSRATGEWYCARAEVGGRVTKSNRNDDFGHVFYPCLRLPAQRPAR